MAAQIFSAIFVIIVGVGGCVAYFWGANKLLDLIFPSRGVAGAAAVDNLRRQGLVRPWLYCLPSFLRSLTLTSFRLSGMQPMTLALSKAISSSE